VGAIVFPIGVTVDVNWTVVPGNATRVDGKFELSTTVDAPITVTERLGEVLACQLRSCGVNFRLNTWAPALSGCAAVSTVKLKANGGFPASVEVAIAAPLSSRLTVPVGAGPGDAVVNRPVIWIGVPDATVPDPVLLIDKAVVLWTKTLNGVVVPDQFASPE